jgi:hypothetical protein
MPTSKVPRELGFMVEMSNIIQLLQGLPLPQERLRYWKGPQPRGVHKQPSFAQIPGEVGERNESLGESKPLFSTGLVSGIHHTTNQ